VAIYTKKGDKGETQTLNTEKKITKDSITIRAIGALDEANSYLGVARANITDVDVQRIIISFQNDLFTIAGNIAGADIGFNSKKIKVLETIIDELEGKLPVLKNFIVAGDAVESAHLMYARTLIRKAERAVVRLSKRVNIPGDILIYLNRLSDATFMLVRYIDYINSTNQSVWKGRD
jgi:cob(I)alamin adenosyltransferase